jgi:hypothetical protein
VEHDLQDRQVQLVELSERTLLRDMMERVQDPQDDESESLESYGEIAEYLQHEKDLVDEKRESLQREKDASWFLTDAKGIQV